AVVLTKGPPVLVDDGSALRQQSAPLEERPVVVAAEEAGLLALGSGRDRQPRARRLLPCLLLRLPAEREPDANEPTRIKPREHVRLILLGVYSAGEEQTSSMLDGTGVVSSGQPSCTCPPGEREQLAEAESSVAPSTGIRGLAAHVPADERLDDCSSEL